MSSLKPRLRKPTTYLTSIDKEVQVKSTDGYPEESSNGDSINSMGDPVSTHNPAVPMPIHLPLHPKQQCNKASQFSSNAEQIPNTRESQHTNLFNS
ncbi:hypothetical protein DSO57_1026790 [Entomophthora muscae]|uniref:Uncharacterized protein n=1 Tax=Entomophthora muscae TaxID=34485 RepID=A0ACC2U0P8_9FUNG|nr:hypothetical protein DSO57_1026790 [Entomophthora muscae]